MAAKEIFKRGWMTAGGGELWNCRGTYDMVPFEKLPSVGEPSNNFEWLDSVSETLRLGIEDSCTLSCEENELSSLPDILGECAQLGLRIPASFQKFIMDSALHAKVPSCTCCFLSLSDKLIPLPEAEGHFLLRFLNDSQSCVLWYLCLSRNEDPWVIASCYFFDPEIFKVMEYQGVERTDLVRESFLSADSFTEFVYRFWIENTIWYSYHKKLEMTPLQRDYILAARDKR